MKLSRELLDECKEMALELAPELAAAPLYAMNVPKNFVATGDCSAFTTSGAISLDLRDALVADNRWRGPGHIVVFCQMADRNAALGTTIHEISHLLPFKLPARELEPTDEGRAFQRALMAAQIAGPPVHLPTMPNWFESHGHKFIRRCLHLHHRAWQLGYEIGLPEIAFAGWSYDLSAPWAYKWELRDESAQMITASFAEIEATKAPAGFYKLFVHDFTAWIERRRREAEEAKTTEQVAEGELDVSTT